MHSTSAHLVVVLAQEGAYPFELGIPSRIFGATDSAYDVQLSTPTGEPITTNAGFDVVPSVGPEILASADTVIIAPVDPRMLRPHLTVEMESALERVRDDARLVSICTGSFTLAAAGRLIGRTAATHWQCSPLFRDWYPEVELDENVLFSGDGSVMTSAGAAAGIDLCLHLIREDFGVEVATQAARRCVVAPHREGGQSQFIERPIPDAPDLSTSSTRVWALERIADDLSIARLAQHAHMSERTFVRRFRADTGLAVGEWITQQRIAAARHLLEATDLSIDSIAAEVGYATATSLRRHLASQLGLSPTAYRRTHRA
ncbi:transcriptional regulator GlxA family with amidase domain [Microbacteriaceae bacterium SG_E_30_P1]|uniref:Transcriptional regulator GlxA family with amidase domain n=1 Tax=Antiquaquibacter oligotrophicus TaxID=2880260 RepID=A0ABT6KTY0_9MICO|nr:helix-turn-helix domain-containing protein [Antiquaquibacter oligotrophicus]MDH6182562.1 transcriptional regulator GlxA family with amidase domain [Antiquaquibacter oligotrophicus]UDF14471.1 helix-turn-helix domain-containing protein [Antiquaquibacter oligotrophicus]